MLEDRSWRGLEQNILEYRNGDFCSSVIEVVSSRLRRAKRLRTFSEADLTHKLTSTPQLSVERLFAALPPPPSYNQLQKLMSRHTPGEREHFMLTSDGEFLLLDSAVDNVIDPLAIAWDFTRSELFECLDLTLHEDIVSMYFDALEAWVSMVDPYETLDLAAEVWEKFTSVDDLEEGLYGILRQNWKPHFERRIETT